MAVIINNGKGTIKIPNSIIGEVAYRAAKECGGVASVAGSQHKARRGLDGGVKVSVKDGGLEIKLDVVMRYGVSISEISSELSNLIRKRVTEFTGVEDLELFVNVGSISV